jgi:dTDP-4-dehydrorhamnose 3,5-epimerase
VYAVHGEIFDVAIDIRIGFPTFGRVCEFVLSSEYKRQVYIPEAFAHGFCVTSERAVVVYKCTDFYAPHAESGVLWNDPDLAIRWPVQAPILSDKDHAYLPLRNIPQDRLPQYGRTGA